VNNKAVANNNPGKTTVKRVCHSRTGFMPSTERSSLK
jgi:hypothetical protein